MPARKTALEIDPDYKIANAVAYGWDGGKARAFEALLPYVRHLNSCGAIGSENPRDERCCCGLRQVWRIRETE